MSNFYYGDYDSFDVNDEPFDDFDREDIDDIFEDDDDEDWSEFDENEIISFDAVAATILFPVEEGKDIKEIEKKADEWVEFSEEVFAKEDLVNVNDDADIFTYSVADTEQNYFCYWQ